MPKPPGMENSGPAHFPTVAPVPAPQAPSGISVPDAELAAEYPDASVGLTFADPVLRSNMTAAGTIGTTPHGVRYPIPRSSRGRVSC